MRVRFEEVAGGGELPDRLRVVRGLEAFEARLSEAVLPFLGRLIRVTGAAFPAEEIKRGT